MHSDIPCSTQGQALQHVLLETLQAHSGGRLFLPCLDQSSPKAKRNAVIEWFWPEIMDFWLALALMPFKVLLLPAVWGFLHWRAQRPQPGWDINFEARTLRAIQQQHNGLCPLEAGMGVLAHHRVIEITHLARGPVLTLFTATRSTDPEDQIAQEALARLLAERLALRLTGCRVNLA